MRLPLLVLLLACPQMAPAKTAQVLVTDYCAAVRKSDEAAAIAMMAPALQEAVAEARRANDVFAAAHPGDKPPLGDGIRLAAFPDTPQDCQPQNISDFSATIYYRPTATTDGAWRDRLDLVPDGDGGVLIGDIAFGMKDDDTLSLWLDQARQAE